MSTTTIRSSRLLPAAALFATGALLLSACGGTDDSAGNEAATDTAATSAAPSPLTDARALEQAEATMESPGGMAQADTNPKSEEADPAAESQLVVTDIRVGEHDGKDRVVFELAGTGVPGYEVAYVPDAAQQGSGAPVEVPGEAKLQVMLSGQTLPMTIGETEVPVGTVSGAAAGDVAGVAFSGQFEGKAQSVIGVNGGEKPFSAFLVENPTRLVVDIER